MTATALVRGWGQGMAPPEFVQRYFVGVAGETTPDLRAAKRVLEQVFDEFAAAAARRAGRNKEAALMRR